MSRAHSILGCLVTLQYLRLGGQRQNGRDGSPLDLDGSAYLARVLIDCAPGAQYPWVLGARSIFTRPGLQCGGRGPVKGTYGAELRRGQGEKRKDFAGYVPF